MPTNDFKAFAVAPGANVLSQSSYNALAAVSTGWQGGVAKSAEVNKAIRQATFIAAAIAQYVSDSSGQDVLDDGNIANFIAKLKSANGSQYFSIANMLVEIANVGAQAQLVARQNLGLGDASTKNTTDFLSAGGGNYNANFKLSSIATLTSSSNLSSLYSAASSALNNNAIVSGLYSEWYTHNLLAGLVRDSGVNVNGYAVEIDGNRLSLTDVNGNFKAAAAVYESGGQVRVYSPNNPPDFTPYMQSSNNLSDVKNVATARVNIGAAALAGLANQLFSVANATGNNHAVNLGQLNGIISSLSLGSASKANIGNASGQVPDMSYFTKTSGYFKLPSGAIVQWGQIGSSPTSLISAPYPIPFPNNVYQVIGSAVDTDNANIIMIRPADRINYQVVAWVANASGVSRTQTPISWVAIGD